MSCGLCCNGAVCEVALVSSTTDKSFAKLFRKELDSTLDGEVSRLPLPCFAFKGKCTQYDLRPLDCKTYQCGLLRKFLSGKITFESASETIRKALRCLDNTTSHYNALYDQSLTRDEISPVLRKLKREADKEGRKKAFWLRFPDYLTFCYLRVKYFDE